MKKLATPAPPHYVRLAGHEMSDVILVMVMNVDET